MTSDKERKTFSAEDRDRAIQRMQSEEFDLAIIGGGITGAGVARDAASRGMKVALIEASDFASGTSSRSSKLVHGGIRYLENLEFGLVFEALSERQHLFEMAPHLVHPLRFLLPLYDSSRVPPWKMGAGMWLYDALSLFEAPELNQFYDREELALEHPNLSQKGLKGAFAYYDAYMDDDRLVHETLRSAHQFGALAVNYVQAKHLQNGLQCEDKISGKSWVLKSRRVISCVGPWTDRVGQALLRDWQPVMRPSKGVHLTFLKERLPLKDAVVMGAEQRIVFAIPRHEMVIVGTTDTDFKDDPAKVRTEPADVEYLLTVLAKYFPGFQVTARDIVGCYAGVRPLIDDGAKSESKTSREHAIWTDARGVTFVAGGKYTTYRKMAEQVVEHVLTSFSLEDRVKFSQPDTLTPLNPLVSESLLARARQHHRRWSVNGFLPAALTERLADRHGLEAEQLIAAAEAYHWPMTDPEEWVWWAEALHAVEHTMCLHLSDFYLRRTPLVLTRKDHGLGFAPGIAGVMGQCLGWSPKQQQAEINALQNQLQWELAATFSG